MFFLHRGNCTSRIRSRSRSRSRSKSESNSNSKSDNKAKSESKRKGKSTSNSEGPTRLRITEARGHKVHHYTLAVATFIIDFNVRPPQMLIALFNFCKKSVNPQNVLRGYLAEMVTKFCPPLGLSQ